MKMSNPGLTIACLALVGGGMSFWLHSLEVKQYKNAKKELPEMGFHDNIYVDTVSKAAKPITIQAGYQVQVVKFDDELHGPWLIVRRHVSDSVTNAGFDPAFTFAESDYKPIVRKMENGKYEIEFVQDDLSEQP